jgi:DNA-binding response OmpR family regulator
MAYDFKFVKVLVVESSPAMYELIKGVLSLFSVPEINIYSSYTVEEGFSNFCKHDHDLVIVDWLANPDRGILLTKEIRTNKTTPNAFVPIIMTAGSSHINRVIKARDAGISEYLVKPFSAKALADRMSRVIEKPKIFVKCETYVGPNRRWQKIEYTGEERRKQETEVLSIEFQ